MSDPGARLRNLTRALYEGRGSNGDLTEAYELIDWFETRLGHEQAAAEAESEELSRQINGYRDVLRRVAVIRAGSGEFGSPDPQIELEYLAALAQSVLRETHQEYV